MEHRLVVVCASAGGVEALVAMTSALPKDLPATVLVGLHLSDVAPSLLPQVLGRHSTLPVLPARDGALLEPGTVIVGVPDRHLLVVDDRIMLGHGALENGHRPSHDAMLRSAALAAGPDVVGVVLTGLLDDGSAGLRCVDRYGGTCLVQDPADAEFADMPRNALRAVRSARRILLADLAQEVTLAVTEDRRTDPQVKPKEREADLAELALALGEPATQQEGSPPGQPSPFACPDCNGTLNEYPDDDVPRYRCQKGHAWTAHSLLAQRDGAVAEALWIALRALEERADMCRRLARRAEESGQPWALARYRKRDEEATQAAITLRAVLSDATIAPAVLPPAGT